MVEDKHQDVNTDLILDTSTGFTLDTFKALSLPYPPLSRPRAAV